MPAAAAPGALVDPGVARDLGRLDASASYAAFVHFSGVSRDAQHELLRDRGLRVVMEFTTVDVVLAEGPAATFAALTDVPGITYLEKNRRLHLLGDTASWATRARVAQEEVAGGPYYDAEGRVIDGSGVGIAIIDTGIDATHPDLRKSVVKNYEFAGATFVESPNTDANGGHGTHIAGIVGGDGSMSHGTFRGVAPGASIYGFGAGDALFVAFNASAFDYILRNYDAFNPRIRVITNSYGACNSGNCRYDPNSVQSKLVDALVAKGTSVVWAAANNGGNGTVDMTNSSSKNPTPGVISVANYNDNDTGDRNHELNNSSSRGRAGSPETYPDMSAPGTFITAACYETQPVCTTGPTFGYPPFYSTISGTSMAAPHAASVATLLYQARPDLTPAGVEDVLQDTAHKFTAGAAYEDDPQNSGGTTSFDKGAGLVDAAAALDALAVPRNGLAPAETTIFSGDGGDYPTVPAADIEALRVFNDVAGLRYTLTVRDVDDRRAGPLTFGSVDYYLRQKIDGRAYVTSIENAANGATAGPTGTGATEISVDPTANTVSFLVPYENIGNPGENTPAYSVEVQSYDFILADTAPGGIGGELIVAPRYGSAYTVRPTQLAEPSPSPTATTDPSPTPTETSDPSPTPTEETSPSPDPVSGGTHGTYPLAPNDAYWADQWGPSRIGAPQAWQRDSATGLDVKVAVISSGIDLQHEDFACANKLEIVDGANLAMNSSDVQDVDGAGTRVGGVIAACTDNGTGIAGIAPDATLLPFHLGDGSVTPLPDLVPDAIRRAADAGAHVIHVDASEFVIGGGSKPEWDAAVEYAASMGAVLVSPSGEFWQAYCNEPGGRAAVICVGSIDVRNEKSWTTNLPIKQEGPSVVAPGGQQLFFCTNYQENILTTNLMGASGPCMPRRGYIARNGASLAAAHVSGVAALVYDRLAAERSPFNRQDVVEAIVATADDLGVPGHDPVFGSGRVDAVGAVDKVTVVPRPTPTQPSTPTTLAFTADSAQSGQYSDEATFAAQLMDDSGAGVGGKTITFELVGSNATRLLTATTDASGVATASLVLTDDPGAYDLIARFDGTEGEYASSANMTGFVIEKEDTGLELSIVGTPSERSLEARLTDADSGAGIEGRTIEFFVDGHSLGSVTTDASGVARQSLPPRFRNGHHDYEASFGGDTLYRPSSSAVST
ncbi:MAG: S8 family serine peptidase [Actinomycetota bacterium]|nr:S8 family serine peptidase [Actinomycetota bacterium]